MLNASTAAAPTASIQKVTINLSPVVVRNESLEGRDYTVVPAVMMVEGVHEGSEGPLFYPKEELGKTPSVWNHKPIVVYHPTMNGVGISACEPAIIESHKVGILMNTRFEGTQLKTEAWIDMDKAEKVDKRVVEAVTANTMMELSTGLYTDLDETPGEWNGESYIGIARNHRPDHLALLPDQIGACSIADGAGLLRNKALKQAYKTGISEKVALNMLKKLGLIVDNELSHGNIRHNLHSALIERLGIKETDGKWAWIEDVYENFFIYEYDNKLWKLNYTSSETQVTIDDGEAEEVVRVTEYRTIAGTFVGNNRNKITNTKQGQTMDKATMIKSLIQNSGWSEDNRKFLEGLDDAAVKAIYNKEQIALTENADQEKAEKAKKEDAAPATVENKEKQEDTRPAAPQNAAEYIASAPKEIRDVLQNGLDSYEKEKQGLVASITANKRNVFTKEVLNEKSLSELKAIASLAADPEPSHSHSAGTYLGQAGAGLVVDNNAPDEDPLVAPTMDFSSK